MWNNISLTIGLNTVGENDGVLNVTINNVTRAYDKMFWRNYNNVKISAVLFSTFFGGSTPKTATPVDTWTYFKDTSVSVAQR